MNKDFLRKASAHLKKDPVLAKMIKKYGEDLESRYDGPIFQGLIRAIVCQQLSSAAGRTIFERFKKLAKEKDFPNADEIFTYSEDEMRGCGISRPKIKYIRGICEAVINKELKVERLEKLADEEVILELTKLNGVGRWTAEMLLIFSLKRMDIFSLGDLGLRTAVSRLYGVERENIEAIKKISEKWSPYRSIASRYLWLSLEN